MNRQIYAVTGIGGSFVVAAGFVLELSAERFGLRASRVRIIEIIVGGPVLRVSEDYGSRLRVHLIEGFGFLCRWG